MKKLVTLAVFAVLASPALAAGMQWSNVPLVDQDCSKKVAANPDAHDKGCMLMCAKSGFAVIVDGKILKLDKTGAEKALAALEASDKKDHIRVNLTGELAGETIQVASLELVK